MVPVYPLSFSPSLAERYAAYQGTFRPATFVVLRSSRRGIGRLGFEG